MSRFAVEFADNDTITFNCDEVSDDLNTSQETIEQKKKVIYSELMKAIAYLLDTRAKKIPTTQTPAQ